MKKLFSPISRLKGGPLPDFARAYSSPSCNTRISWLCPGCGNYHSANVLPEGDAAPWEWDGSYDRPTLHPSVKVTDGDGAVCHFFLRDGVADFCGDCTHENAGKKIPLAPVRSYAWWPGDAGDMFPLEDPEVRQGRIVFFQVMGGPVMSTTIEDHWPPSAIARILAARGTGRAYCDDSQAYEMKIDPESGIIDVLIITEAGV